MSYLPRWTTTIEDALNSSEEFVDFVDVAKKANLKEKRFLWLLTAINIKQKIKKSNPHELAIRTKDKLKLTNLQSV
jgi:hypothetical protein